MNQDGELVHYDKSKFDYLDSILQNMNDKNRRFLIQYLDKEKMHDPTKEKPLVLKKKAKKVNTVTPDAAKPAYGGVEMSSVRVTNDRLPSVNQTKKNANDSINQLVLKEKDELLDHSVPDVGGNTANLDGWGTDRRKDEEI